MKIERVAMTSNQPPTGEEVADFIAENDLGSAVLEKFEQVFPRPNMNYAISSHYELTFRRTR